MRVTVSLNKETTEEVANTGKVPDLSKLVSSRSKSEIVRVFGRGRFVSIETTPAELSRLKDELGHMCLFSLKSELVPFG